MAAAAYWVPTHPAFRGAMETEVRRRESRRVFSIERYCSINTISSDSGISSWAPPSRIVLRRYSKRHRPLPSHACARGARYGNPITPLAVGAQMTRTGVPPSLARGRAQDANTRLRRRYRPFALPRGGCTRDNRSYIAHSAGAPDNRDTDPSRAGDSNPAITPDRSP
jgi:hypothetical protein